MGDLTLFELPPSPNNQKARIALGFKKLPFERSILELRSFPGDRSKIVEVSGQPRTPVLRHGESAIFDSGAILRYLEANFPDSPRLFSTDYREFGEIERWETFGRTRFSEPIGMMFGEALKPGSDPDAGVIRRANELMRDVTGALEEQLAQSGFLVGDRLTAADVTAAPMVYLAALPPAAASGPVTALFVERFALGEGRDRTRDWVKRVVDHDPHPPGA